MAIYQKDITKNIEPAMANPATMQQAGAYTRAAISTLAEGAEAYYKGKVAKDLFDVEQEATKLAGEFLISNQAASVAAQRASAFEGTRPSAAPLEFAEGARGRQQEARIEEQLKGFDTELTRLKDAAQGGMPNEQYIARIDAITKKAVAQYPGLADDIRQRVGRVTGLPGADRWAQMEFVKERFAKPTGKSAPTELDMAIKDMAAVGPLGVVGTQEELFKLYHTDRPEYNRRMTEGRKILTLKTQDEVLKAQIATQKGHGDQQADLMSPSFNAVFAASLGASVLTNAVQDKEKTFAAALDLRAKGVTPTSDIEAWKTHIAVHNAQMRTSIEVARSTALQNVELYIAANAATLSEGKKKELRDTVIRQSDEALRMYADDKGVGLQAIANVLSTYRDKGIKEQQAIINLAIAQQNAMQNNPLVTQYYQGGAARERLKLEQPFFYEFMVKQEQQLFDNLRGIGGMLNTGADLNTVTNAIDNASKDPQAVKTPDTVTPENAKAVHEVVNAQAKQSLDKLATAGIVNQTEVTMISAALSTDIETGASVNIIEKHFNKWSADINKLPPSDLNIIKENTSNSSVKSITSLQELKQSVESKYGVALTFGVNDAGEIRPILDSGAQQGMYTRAVSPERARQNAAMASAAQEFMNKALPRFKNLTNVRSMLTGEDRTAISTEYATLLNGNTPYKGFFSTAPKPIMANVEDAAISSPAEQKQATPPPVVEGEDTEARRKFNAPPPAEAPKKEATTQVSGKQSLDDMVVTQLNKMKEKDPNLNVNYIFDVYKRASPDKKEKLRKLFEKALNITMSDLAVD